MTRELAKMILAEHIRLIEQENSPTLNEDKEALKMAISALEQEPCDAISREAVIKLFNGQIGSESALILHKIKKLPSVQPSRKGHWIKGEEWCETVNGFERWGNDYTCSECGLPLARYTLTDFCPNCGAEMVEPQESEDKE